LLPRLSRKGFGDANPLLFGDLVLVDVNIVSKSIEISAKHERRVHERTWINELAFLLDLHLLDVQDEAAVEDKERQCALTSED